MTIDDYKKLGFSEKQAKQLVAGGAYWKERFDKLESESYKQGIDYTKRLEREYRKTIVNCEKVIARWYQRLADNNGVSMAEARKLLSKDELTEFKWSVEEYIKYGRENAINSKWIKELENASAKAHITRYEQIKLELQNEVNVLYDHFDRGTKDLLNGVFKNNYKQTAAMTGHTSKGLDINRVVKAVETPWAVDGKNFSDRIWENKEKLANTLDRVLTQNIIRGESYSKAVKAVKDEMGTSYSVAKRLVVTETAAVQVMARHESLKDLGCEYYEISVAYDERLCDVCSRFADLPPQSMKDFQIGATAPPFHPNCRCAIVPSYKEVEEKNGGEAVASEMENGVEKSGESGIIKASGALTSKNDPNYARRDNFAESYYSEIRNRNKKYEIEAVAQNSGLSERAVNKIYNHIFINEYLIDGVLKRFDPDYYMAQSWQRLREGKNILPHDITMLKHEFDEKNREKLQRST